MAISYEPILTTTNRGSGVADYILWVPVSHFDVNGIKCPAVPDDNTTNAQLVTIEETHVFLVDHGFLRINCSPAKNNLEANMIGEVGSLKFMKSLKVFIPGSDAALHSQITQMMNEPGIYLVKDATCPADMWYQLGCDCVFAQFKDGKFTTGTNKDGVKGYEITIEAPSEAVTLYAGDITYAV